MATNILLVRHGRSAHRQTGFLGLAEFVRWREAYEAAGIDERDRPPAALQALASSSGIIVASPALRAVQSAGLLDPGRDIPTSPLLRELELAPPNIRRWRMPLLAWALAVGVRQMIGASAIELRRAGEAAEWLGGLAERHGTVVAVTHGGFRSVLSAALAERGWQWKTPRKRSRHWSVWSFER